MVASAVGRRSTRRWRHQAETMAVSSAATATAVERERTAVKSARLSVVTRRAGVAAKKQTRVRTPSASAGTARVRTSSQPTAMTAPKTASPATTSAMVSPSHGPRRTEVVG